MLGKGPIIIMIVVVIMIITSMDGTRFFLSMEGMRFLLSMEGVRFLLSMEGRRHLARERPLLWSGDDRRSCTLLLSMAGRRLLSVCMTNARRRSTTGVALVQ